jgi:hypothetical protein
MMEVDVYYTLLIALHNLCLQWLATLEKNIQLELVLKS